MFRFYNSFFVLALPWLMSCSLAPDFHKPDIKTPESFRNAGGLKEAPTLSDQQWWQQFGSDELSGLIQKAIAENNDLVAATARVEQAQALAKIAGAPLFPNLSINGDAARHFNNRPSRLEKSAYGTYQAGGSVSYELDLFNKVRDAAHSAHASAIASAHDRRALELSITAQVAEGYFNLLALNQRVTLAEHNLKNFRDILALTQMQFDVGSISEVELAQQKTLVANEEATLASLKQQREAAHNALAVLLNTAPESFTVTATQTYMLKSPQTSAALPATVIAHRPDVSSLEEQMKAANFDIGVARAAFFPSLNLSASTVVASTSTPPALLSTLAASAGAPLFTGGTLEGGFEKATAHQKELAADYRKAVLTAFSETENGFYGIEATSNRLHSLTEAASQSQIAYDAAKAQYKVGSIDYLALLNAQTSLLQAQDALAQANADRLSASVELFKALGGGWKDK